MACEISGKKTAVPSIWEETANGVRLSATELRREVHGGRENALVLSAEILGSACLCMQI